MSETIEKRPYTVSIILDSRGVEEEIEAQIDRIRTGLAEVGAEIESTENLGRQEFVRITDKEHTGDIFLQFELQAPPAFFAEVNEKFRLDRTVKRVFVESK